MICIKKIPSSPVVFLSLHNSPYVFIAFYMLELLHAVLTSDE